MQKKVIAVAVAGALGALTAPLAVAQTSTVQIGGSIHLIYVSSHSSNSTGANANTGGIQIEHQNHDNLHTSEPELFVRGEENIGGGNAIWFQCTSTFDILGVAANAGAGDGWCGRNSALGIKGGWGNLFFGNWDMPNKLMVTPVRGWFGLNNVFAGAGRMLWQNPASDTGATGPSFHRREARSISYHSPNWSGFAFRAAYSAQNEATNLSAASLPTKPRMWAADVTYSAGPLYLGAAYEKHKDMNPGGVAIGTTATTYSGGKDDNWTLGASYTFGGFIRLSGIYTWSNWDVTNTTDLKTKGWWLMFDWTISGPHSLKGQYAKRGDGTGSATITVGNVASNDVGAQAGKGTGGKVYGLQYAYEFSKRSTGYLGYNKASGDAGAKEALGISAASLGQSQTVWGGGFRHRF